MISKETIRSHLADMTLAVGLLRKLAETNHRVAEFKIDFLDSVWMAVRLIAEFEELASPAEIQLISYPFLKDRITDCEQLADSFPDRIAEIYVPLLMMLVSAASSEVQLSEANKHGQRGLQWLERSREQIPKDNFIFYQEVLDPYRNL